MTWQEEILGTEAYLHDRIEKLMCAAPDDEHRTRALAAYQLVLRDLEERWGSPADPYTKFLGTPL
jgi:hypothetical protein